MATNGPSGGGETTAQTIKPVYVPKDRNLPVKCVYYYRLTDCAAQHPTVEAYRHLSTNVISIGTLPALMEHLTREARAGRLEPIGPTVGSITWQRKSFIAVVVDDSSDRLIVGDAMEFARGEHTFRDGEDITVPNLGLSGFHCINHMKKNRSDDPDLGKEKETFDVCIHTVLHAECHESLMKRRWYAHYESGTNQGPPL